MKTIFSLFTFILLAYITTSAQTISQVKYPVGADVKVYATPDSTTADLVVYQTQDTTAIGLTTAFGTLA